MTYKAPSGDAILSISNLLYVHHMQHCRQIYNLRQRIERTPASDAFYESWVHIGRSGNDLIAPLQGIFQPHKSCAFQIDDAIKNFRSNIGFNPNAVDRHNQNFTYFRPDAADQQNLENFMRGVATEVENTLRYHFAVVNVRCWEGKAGTNFDGFGWHYDGFIDGVVKILIYLAPPNLTNGTTMVRNGDQVIYIQAEHPAWVLLDPSRLLHAGSPGEKGGRRLIEITMVPVPFETDVTCIPAGNNANYPWIPPVNTQWRNQEWPDDIAQIAPQYGR